MVQYVNVNYINTYFAVTVKFGSPSLNIHVCNVSNIFHICHHKSRNGRPIRGVIIAETD